MPPRDPRLCPALERALPRDSGTFRGYRPDNSPWLVLFGDGNWRPVTVRAWWLDRDRRQVVQLSWHAGGSTWTEGCVYDGEKARESPA